jgi:hypothetical protein
MIVMYHRLWVKELAVEHKILIILDTICSMGYHGCTIWRIESTTTSSVQETVLASSWRAVFAGIVVV